MAKQSKIGWTDSSWNPWMGCRKVSPGCAYCYAERDMGRYGRDFDTVTRAKDPTFYAPLRWKEPRLIFTCSWSDFFIEEADEWRQDAWDVIRRTPDHNYLVLTKRIERASVPIWENPKEFGVHDEPLNNVMLMTTVENQRQADERIPKLLEIPARWHGLSVEPLLGPVDLDLMRRSFFAGDRVDWVIVGGESGGPAERRLVAQQREHIRGEGIWKDWVPWPDREQWVRSLRDQCQEAGVPVFFKQWGGPKPTSGGRMLDGCEWNQVPKEWEPIYRARGVES